MSYKKTKNYQRQKGLKEIPDCYKKAIKEFFPLT